MILQFVSPLFPSSNNRSAADIPHSNPCAVPFSTPLIVIIHLLPNILHPLSLLNKIPLLILRILRNLLGFGSIYDFPIVAPGSGLFGGDARTVGPVDELFEWGFAFAVLADRGSCVGVEHCGRFGLDEEGVWLIWKVVDDNSTSCKCAGFWLYRKRIEVLTFSVVGVIVSYSMPGRHTLGELLAWRIVYLHVRLISELSWDMEHFSSCVADGMSESFICMRRLQTSCVDALSMEVENDVNRATVFTFTPHNVNDQHSLQNPGHSFHGGVSLLYYLVSDKCYIPGIPTLTSFFIAPDILRDYGLQLILVRLH